MGPRGNGRRLHLNEYRFPHDPAVVNAFRGRAAALSSHELLSRYTTGPPADLLAALARYVGVPGSDWLAVSAGSDEALRAVIDTCGLRGQASVVIGVPTYTHFTSYAKMGAGDPRVPAGPGRLRGDPAGPSGALRRRAAGRGPGLHWQPE